MTRLLQVLRYACALLVACGAVFGQGLTPTTPAKEYVRIGDRIIATENAGVLLISNVTATSISSTGATITWTTTIGGTSQVDYGTTASYGTSTTLDPTMVTTHSQPVTGLVVNTL